MLVSYDSLFIGGEWVRPSLRGPDRGDLGEHRGKHWLRTRRHRKPTSMPR